MKNIFILLMTIFMVSSLRATVALPYIFSDNMVLQREKKIPIWGTASKGEKIAISFNHQRKTTVADQKGNWIIWLDSEQVGGPYTCTVKGSNTIIYKNVLVGDVWLCSGQSNMEWTMAQTDGYEDELKQTTFPLIRQIKILKEVSTQPQSNVLKTSWQESNKTSLADFSGVAYFFAKKMVEETNVPIGIIHSSWGGTNIETWIPKDAFEQSEHFKTMISGMKKISPNTLHEIDKKQIEQIEQKTRITISSFNPKQFLDNDFKDENIGTISVPKTWEEQGYNFNGIAWYRKTIYLQADDIQKDATIFLGKIDDQDISYFNGVKIGESYKYDILRKYTIPQNLLKVGKNVIVIRVVDRRGNGGIWGSEDSLKLITNHQTLSLAGGWKFGVEKLTKDTRQNDFPSFAYNAMIAPLVPYAIKGFLWYQGEANTSRADEYKVSFPLLINSWRGKFGAGEMLPFYFVQLATYGTPGNSNDGCEWAELREAQTQTLNVQNTGMAVTTDIGDPNDIHPRNKKSVGERLAHLALHDDQISPVYKEHQISNEKVIVSFSPEATLVAKKNDTLKGFEIAGSDSVFYPATAQIKDNRIVAYSPKVSQPVALRYGWKSDNSDMNLFTDKGLPVSPFRTDDMHTITRKATYTIHF